MKILKISEGKGYFCFNEDDDWMPIDEIDKDALLKLLDLFLTSEVEIDEYNSDTLLNQAQKIIYKSIHDKFNSLKENKNKFKDESDRMYLDAIKKYQHSIASGE